MIATIIGQRGTGKSTALRGMIAAAPRLLVIDTMAEHCDVVDEAILERPKDLAARFEKPSRRFRLAYSPAGQEDFEAAVNLAWELGDVLLAIDEIDNYAKPGWAPLPLLHILRYGRHRRISAIATTRRPADIPRAWTAQTDHWLSFRVTERNDLAYLSGIFGSWTARIATLQRFRFLRYQVDARVISECEILPAGSARRVSVLQDVAP